MHLLAEDHIGEALARALAEVLPALGRVDTQKPDAVLPFVPVGHGQRVAISNVDDLALDEIDGPRADRQVDEEQESGG